MRVDIVTIFPDYLAPLALSLPGKAQQAGLLEVHVHDLRAWAHDRHRTVDDAPYGGGAGMVMRPEPWGEALASLVSATGPTDPTDPTDTVLVVPTPSGEPFTQRAAAELAAVPHLVFACGRYEGIDQRVLEDAATRMTVREVSLGDYVLNGGEVAALAVTEAVVRLLPGFLGNPASLDEESHGESGLLEYPVYTRPPTWRGYDVPPVLLGGDHARIAAWRHDQSVLRTAERRPDLLHPSQALRGDTGADLALRLAVPADAGELLTLQLACWVSEARANDSLDVPPLREGPTEVAAGLREWTTFVLHAGPRLVGSVRGRLAGDEWQVGRLMVAPDLQGRGLGRRLLAHAEQAAPPAARRVTLFTGAGSERNLRMYRRAGYTRSSAAAPEPGAVQLGKSLRRG